MFRSTFESNLRVEQGSQKRLQQDLANEKHKVSSLQFDIHELNIIKQVKMIFLSFLLIISSFVKEYDRYKRDTTNKEEDFTRRLKEQDETIRELALKLEVYITREDASREKVGIRASKWVKDEDVRECCQCKKEFNALKRKHHCRQ